MASCPRKRSLLSPVGGASCPANPLLHLKFTPSTWVCVIRFLWMSFPSCAQWPPIPVGGASCPANLLLHLKFTPPIRIILRPFNQAPPNRILIAIPHNLIQRFFPSNPAIIIFCLPYRTSFITQRVNLSCCETLEGMHDACQRLIAIQLNDCMNMVRHYHNTYPPDATLIF